MTAKEDTHIDLGEDLLEKTVMIPGLPAPREQETSSADSSDNLISPLDIPAGEPGSIDDLLHSAKILVNEGMIDDAKKILHQILRIDSGNRAALEAIDGIQKEALKHIFREGQAGREGRPRPRAPQAQVGETGQRVSRGERPERPEQGAQGDPLGQGELDPEILMRKLDRDLGLGIFTQTYSIPVTSDVSLFQNHEEMEAFTLELEKGLVGSKIQDWVDLGIAFLEMDFYQIAVRLFTGACRQINSEMHGEESLSATSLLAFSLILLGRPYEAISRLQPLLRDLEIRAEQKIELYYLMGRIYELLKKQELALHFYRQVLEIDFHYRDVEYRIHR